MQWVEKLRYPTKEEIRLQAWLALSRGAKGLKYFAYLSNDPSIPPVKPSQERTFGILTEDRMPRAAVLMDPANNYPDSANLHIYDWVKELNDTMQVVGPIMANLQCHYSFGVNHPYGMTAVIEDMSASNLQITKVVAVDPDYAQYDYFEVGSFKDKIHPDYDFLMLVNRYCQSNDTVDVSVTFKYTNPFNLNFFLVDALNGQPVSDELKPGVLNTVSVKIIPGGGRLLKFIPYSSKLDLTSYSNFRFVDISSDLNTPYTKDSINIVQKYWTYNVIPDTLLSNPSSSIGHWETVSTGWQPYSEKVIQYLYNSQENNLNEFEVQFKIGGKYYTPKINRTTLFDDVSPINGEVLFDGAPSYVNDTCIYISIHGSDQLSGMNEMRYGEFPFGNPNGYENLMKNGDCKTTTDWVLDNAVYENGYIHLLGDNTGPGPVQTGSSAKQVIPGEDLEKYRGKLLRLKDDIYSHNVIVASKRLDLIYGDSLNPSALTFIDKSIASSSGSLWKAEWDTFTLNVDSTRPISRMELTYFVSQIEVPPPPPDDDPVILKSGIPNPLALDNIILEPVEFSIELPDTGIEPKYTDGGDANDPDTTDIIYDGWWKFSTNFYSYILSPGDGMKKIYLQLRDNAGNESFAPGWIGSVILDMTKPYVKINSPDDEVYVNGIVSVYGSYGDANFEKWVLDYKKNGNADWVELIRSGANLPDLAFTVPTELLYNWDTETTDDGVYLLRLTSYDKAGNLKADTNYVYVCNTNIPNISIVPDFAVFNSLPVDGTTDALGNVYATDTQDDKIWKFTPDGDSLLCFGYKYTCTDTLGLNHPKGIAVDDSGFIWVTDCYQSKLKKYDNLGNYICTIGKHGNQQGEFNQPTGIAVKGNLIYVSDHLNDRMQVFNRNGTFIRQFGNNILKQPAGIAISSDGRVYVSDSKNNRIAVFNDSGNMIDSLGCELGLREPWDICFDCRNNLYIADVYNNKVVQLDPWGNKLLAFGTHGSDAGEFKLPQGLAVSPDGKYLYVIDTHNDRIQRFALTFDIGTSGPLLSGRKKDNVIAPHSFMLGQSYPNPTAFKATIEYALPKEAKVRLNIYNTLGQKVRTMVNETQTPGYYSVNWDKKDDSGNETVAGVYFYRLEAGENRAIKKMVVIK